ncbi:MAG TPA: HAMP domain-containing sensor histidine kinase [Anaerolineales bacterium]|jgi:signal transduction histidine kinase|nr:HAMP domain-containing sensor histidine kinase [Anaerolineales bacterium]
MSLQIRLAMFYTALVGVVLFAFGWAVYNRSTEILMQQIDSRLQSAIMDVSNTLRSQRNQEVLITYDPSILLQLHDANGELLKTTEATLEQLSGRVIDPMGFDITLETRNSYYSEMFRENFHYKALSVLVMADETTVGVLQAGTSLASVDQLRADLLRSLVLIGLVITTVAAGFGYYTAHSALIPLATVTQIASEITRADDLSLRIPQERTPPDEVGQLIQAFNETMERLEHLFNAQRRFLADVSHELRTPLTVLQGNAGLMRKMGEFDLVAIDSMSKEIARLTRMVEDLLLMAQAESGRLELEMVPVELDTLLLEVYQQARILAGDHKTIRIEDIDQVQVIGDKDRLKQVLLNLVSNAIKFTRPDGKIILSLKIKEHEAWLAVRDDGQGIHPKDLEHVFERFYRAEKSRAKIIDYDQKGFGLGLSIAYWIMLRHQGRIEVESEYGKGTTFTICMPYTNPDRASVFAPSDQTVRE